jgi:hypothetical protein
MTTESAENITVGTGALAKLLNLTPQRVNQLAAAGIIAKTGRGRFKLGPGVRGYVGYLSSQPWADGPSGAMDYRTERTRLVKVQADLAQLALEQGRKELVPIDQIAEGVRDVFVAARAKWLAVPTKYASRVAPDNPAQGFEVLSIAVRETLVEISDEAPAEIVKLDGAT